jgi:hypothetical protein
MTVNVSTSIAPSCVAAEVTPGATVTVINLSPIEVKSLADGSSTSFKLADHDTPEQACAVSKGMSIPTKDIAFRVPPDRPLRFLVTSVPAGVLTYPI